MGASNNLLYNIRCFFFFVFFSGRIIVNFNESQGGIFIKIMKTNPNNPIHNIRFIIPGFEARHESFPFYPQFLENKARFSVFRFMDFFHTNGHTVSDSANEVYD